ncbi:MAG: hypothetical protein ABI743_12175, partial [bacterium]
ETTRLLGYALALRTIPQHPIDGIGWNGGRTLSLANGLKSWGPENMFLVLALEGGFLVAGASLAVWILLGIPVAKVLWSPESRVNDFAYALAISTLCTSIYDISNGSAHQMCLRFLFMLQLGMFVGLQVWTRPPAPDADTPVQ